MCKLIIDINVIYNTISLFLIIELIMTILQKVKKVVTAAPRLPLRITNVTTTASFGVTLDLMHISEVLVCMYNRKRFPNCVYQMRNPRCTILLCESGKVVSTGTRTPEVAKTAMFHLRDKLARKMPYHMWDAHIWNFRVVNYVGSFSTGFMLNLHKIKSKYPLHSKYTVKQFPAARYATKKPLPKAKLTAFQSGRVNIAGAKTPKDLSLICKAQHNMREFRLIE